MLDCDFLVPNYIINPMSMGVGDLEWATLMQEDIFQTS